MKTILFVNACIRGSQSRTLQLAEAYLTQRNQMGDFQVTTLDLATTPMPYLAGTDFLENSPPHHGAKVALAKQFAQADEILIAAPFWEFAFPAALSCYLENISEVDVAFRYSQQGSVGMCKASHMTYLFTSGDLVPPQDDLGTALLRRLATLYGIPHFHVVSGQGLDTPTADVPAIMEGALSETTALAKEISSL